MNTIRQLIKVLGKDMSFIELGAKGTGDDVVIMHGSFANADIMYNYALKFAKDNHVIILDLPGHFVSPEQRCDDFEDLTTIVIETISSLDRLGIISRKPVLHGWSLAGSLVLNVAARKPQLLKSGVVLNGDCQWVCGVIPHFKNNQEFIGAFEDMLSKPSLYSDEEEIWDLMDNLKFCTCNWEVANADLTMDYSLNIENKLKDIEVHIDIIFGNMDFLTQMGRQMSLAASIKDCRLYVVAGGMHQVCIDRPQHVYETLVKSK